MGKLRLTSLVLLAAIFFFATTAGYGDTPPPTKIVTTVPLSAHLVFWDQARGLKSIEEHAALLTEVEPFWYQVGPAGIINPYRDTTGQAYASQKLVTEWHQNNIKVVPTLANMTTSDTWPRAAVETLLHDPTKRSQHIAAIVDLVVQENYDGIEIDYEDLQAIDRDVFSAFITELGTALHAHDKILTVDVYAKTSEPGGWNGPQSQDLQAIGQVADKVNIMLYNFSWSRSAAGPIDPPSWVRDVLAFMATQVPSAKIVYSLPLFGYDWVGKVGDDLSWADITAEHRAQTLNWDSASNEPWFSYEATGIKHTIWFQNASSTQTRVALGLKAGVSEINLWRLGGEDPSLWPMLQNELKVN